MFPTTQEQKVFANSDYYFNRAIFYQQSKSWDKALSNYPKAAELSPDNAYI
jgi:tetratricopeptide (TPR) repeat protein